MSALSSLALLFSCHAAGGQTTTGSWRDKSNHAVLENDTIRAGFQAGLLAELRNRITDETLIFIDPAGLPATLPLFGTSGLDLDNCIFSQSVSPSSVHGRLEAPDGEHLAFQWRIEPGQGDLVLQMSAKAKVPVHDLHAVFPGCNIRDYSLVMVDQLGVGEVHQAPFTGTYHGEPGKDTCSRGIIRPLVALFAGQEGGWFVEGRDLQTGPSGLMLRGYGEKATLGFVRNFPTPAADPELFEIRFRAYAGHWKHAADPYIDWMEKGLGFVPLERQSPGWVHTIKNQAYVRVGDFEGLENLARQLDPTKTLIGRMVGFRHYPMGLMYPDYRLTDGAKRWYQRARELGFHAGAHFNYNAVSAHVPEMPDIAERMKEGFALVGTDEEGNELYQALPEAGPLVPDRAKCPRHFYRCSAAYKPWRDTLIEQIREAVESGVDLIYLDEAAWPVGKYVVDGMTAVEGVMLLEKEILEAYPQVAIETEQFNPMASRHAAFALSQMHLGHPLGGSFSNGSSRSSPRGGCTNRMNNATSMGSNRGDS